MKKTREPAVAGYFYPKEKNELLKILGRFIETKGEKQQCKAAVSPHAGYVYSGATAGSIFSRISIPETVILLGPNHTGYGEPYAVSGDDVWLTPLGETEVDKSLAKELVKGSRYLEEDDVAHLREHSLEVQLPFLQFLKNDVRIVPIILSGYVDNPAWIEIGETIADVITAQKREGDVLVVASSDMTHYEEHKTAEEKDHYAIEAILSLDEQLLIQRIYEKNITLCGYGPIIVAITAAKKIGAKGGELIKYTTSGEMTKDYSQVVGYAGIIIR